jgi:hypothetical protein
MKKKLSNLPRMVLPEIAQWVCEESGLFADERSPFTATYTPGDDRVLLIVGENASGKSLAFRLASQIAASSNIMAITLSIRERTGGGLAEMGGMRRAMIFGDEESSSTGAISARVVESGFENLKNRNASLLALEEPELGLSDGYARALGEFIGKKSRELPECACGVMVVTHSRSLGRGMMEGLGATPSFITMSDAYSSYDEWLETQEYRSVEDLLDLRNKAHENFRKIKKEFGV